MSKLNSTTGLEVFVMPTPINIPLETREEEPPELETGDEIPDPTDGEITDPVMMDPFDPTKINIQAKQDTLRNLIDRLRNDEIDMNTEFQRNADLWNSGQMSRLIESILIRFPLPAFYFDASDDDRWLVVDGLQRLSSIRKFVINTEKSLRLSGLEYLNDLKSKTYEDLPRQYKRRIDECPVTLFLIQKGTPSAVKYSIFRRINTGGLVLNSQEIRNALARPREREYLKQLASDKNFLFTIGDQSKRMLDQELVLRFIAFFTQDYLKSPKNIAEFMDESMEALEKKTDTELQGIEEIFRNSMKLCKEIFGATAFEKTDPGSDRRKRKNTTLFEVWSVCLARYLVKGFTSESLVENKDLISKKLQAAISEDGEFFRSISLATQKREHVRIRYDRVNKIIAQSIL